MSDWLHGHMGAVLIGIEILWVGGVLAILVFYFVMRRRLSRRPRADDPVSPPHDAPAHSDERAAGRITPRE